MAFVTVYDLLEVNENASKEEIEKSYLKLVNEYKLDPTLSQEENNDNEIILKKLKLAYDILSDDEKRNKYDSELAKKRAEELIKNVTVQQAPIEENDSQEKQKEEVKSNSANKEIEYEEEEQEEAEVQLTDEEKKELKKAAEKEFKGNLKKAKKAEEEYNRAYNEAYNDYLRKMGYSVKEPLTWKKIKKIIISVVVVIFICALIWILPPTRNLLVQIYEENFIVKSLVDIIIMLFDAIVSAFK